MRIARTKSVAAIVVGGLVVAAGAALSTPPPPNAAPTTASKLGDKAVPKQYATYDARGRRTGKATWRVTTAGGNCCEVLVAATSTGRLLEFGGTYPVYSDDQGKTWTEIAPLAPSTSRVPNPGPRQIAGGEGTIVAAPNGDIVGVGWDPYSGDRLQSFVYKADTKQWYYNEAPLHEPFYDRQWIAVAKGPFTIGTTTVPWVSMVISNFHRRTTLISTDGLNYFAPNQRDAQALAGAAVSAYVPVKPDPDLDYLQEHSETGLVPLPGGGALGFGRQDTATSVNPFCETQILKKDLTWGCFSLPDSEILGRLHTDSRGWLHDVSVEADEVTYRLSTNGGRSWRTSKFAVPLGANVESFDYKAHGRLGLSAIALHTVKEDGNHQDMVMRVDTKKGVATLKDTLFVGDGNMAFTAGLDVSGLISGAKSNRFDFATVAILPNGKIAVGFVDKTYDDPAVAVLA